MVGSNWNNQGLRKKAPSRQRRDALRFLKFNAAKAPPQVLEHSENSSNVQLQGQESFAATVTPRTTDSISPTDLADEQATTMIPSTRSIATAGIDAKPREMSSVQASQLPEAYYVHGSSTCHSQGS